MFKFKFLIYDFGCVLEIFFVSLNNFRCVTIENKIEFLQTSILILLKALILK